MMATNLTKQPATSSRMKNYDDWKESDETGPPSSELREDATEATTSRTVRRQRKEEMIMQIRGGERESRSGDLGQLALSVDFAPPLEPLHDRQQAAYSGHLIEVSLCIRQQQQQGGQLAAAAAPAATISDRKHQFASERELCDRADNTNTSGSKPAPSCRPAHLEVGDCRLVSPAATPPDANHKRRLVYERIDRFPLRLASSSMPSQYQDPIDKSGHSLPFQARTFDACFCFNLLSVRLISSRLLAAERRGGHLDEQLARSWLEMERRTKELRLALLEELSRLVRPRGKIMVTVFAYECQKQNIAADGRQCKQTVATEPCGNSKRPRTRARRQHETKQQQQRQQLGGPSDAAQMVKNSQCAFGPLPVPGEDQLGGDESHEEEEEEEEEESCCPRCRLEWVERAELRQQPRGSPERGDATSDKGDFKIDKPSVIKASDAGDEGKAQRRYSHLAIWRAISGEQTPPSPSREQLGEAARKLGRRLSLGGSSLIGRLATNLNLTNLKMSLNLSSNLLANNQSSEREELKKPPTCDIKVEREEDAQEQEQKPQQIDLLSLFDQDEFAKRHRQSIAVQTFFTKSIEVEEDENLGGGSWRGTNDEDNMFVSPAKAERLASEEADKVGKEEEEDITTTTTTSTTSGWTAPPSTRTTQTESSLNAELEPGAANQANGTASAPPGGPHYTYHTDCTEREQPALPLVHQEALSRNESPPTVDLANFDLDSFTLMTTTSTTNESHAPNQHHRAGLAEPTTADGADAVSEHQRRAFSETEAYEANLNQFGPNQRQPGSCSFEDHQRRGLKRPNTNGLQQNQEQQPAPRDTAGASPAQAPAFGGRQHAQPSANLANIMALSFNTSGTTISTSASTSSTGNHQNQAPNLSLNLIRRQQHLQEQQQRQFASGELGEWGGWQASPASRYQQRRQQQWCHSNTFSSSLNSDNSTSGGGPTKDTTDKDSSRRTSTLSGISSIYQQEISLATGAGASTPGASTSGAPISSIPEQELGAVSGSGYGLNNPCDATKGEAVEEAQVESKMEQVELRNEQQTASIKQQTEALNLQRVAASLRSQLRERMRAPLSAFMGLAGADTSGTFEGPQPIAEEVAAEAAATCEFPTNSLGAQQHRHSSSKPNQQDLLSQNNTTYTMRSFFRSTSSAAFQAFASSFQQQQQPSTASTPTGTTVLTQPFGSSGSQQLLANVSMGNSLSSQCDVFEAGNQSQPSTAPYHSPQSGRFNLFQSSSSAIAIPPHQCQSLSELSPQPSSPQAQNQASSTIRSPLSPLSATSTRFFARIRDKFSSPASQQSLTRPSSNFSSSNSAMIANMAQPAEKTELGAEEQQKVSLESSSPPTTTTSKRPSGPSDSTDGLEAAGELSNTSSSLRRRRAQNRQQQLAEQVALSTQADSSDDYEFLVSGRRPSLQKQLDEQVNQVYRLAVERKLLGHNNSYQPELGQNQSIYLPPGYGESVHRQQQQRQWMEGQQPSIDSSSSARSLRSCWFSMPELYMMNRDSSSQSPTTNGYAPLAGLITNLEADHLLCDQWEPQAGGPQQAAGLEQSGCQQQQQWPSEQLYKQVVNETQVEGHNWSLSDLNLTSDDIAAPDCHLGAKQRQQQQAHSDNLEQARMINTTDGNARPQQASQLFKCSTLDDSVCQSIQSVQVSAPAAAFKMVAAVVITDEQQQDSSNQNEGNDSRPTSQNSTISNTSCALSELNSSGNEQLATDPQPDQHQQNLQWSCDRSTSSLLSAANQQAHEETPRPATTTPASLLDPAQLAGQKQRAMSLAPTVCDKQLGSGGLLAPPTSQLPVRRRSAMGLLAGREDIAPAAASLELRLAARRQRVRLTDLHPVTFINDAQFLKSMSSLKGASETKLEAIFNGPVGRRLSVNAELAQRSPFSSNKSGIKIGLTGYIYMNREHQQLRRQQLRAELSSGRRPSLAANFWLRPEPEGASPEELLAQNQWQSPNRLSVSQGAGNQQRRRAASCTPETVTPLAYPRSPPPPPPASPQPPPGKEHQKSSLLMSRLSESSIEVDLNLERPNSESPPSDHRGRKERFSSKDQRRILLAESSDFTTNEEEEEEEEDYDDDEKWLKRQRQHQQEDSSSDDGDIDKLVNRYATPLPPAQPLLRHQQQQHRRRQHHQRLHQSPTAISGGNKCKLLKTATQDETTSNNTNTSSSDERVVPNEMIIKQLLKAARAATSPDKSRRRRYSAINLYQRDDDMFVANSMRRAPDPSDALKAVPLLAANLAQNLAPSEQLRRRLQCQLPVVAPSARLPGQPIKSIITGSSGLEVVATPPIPMESTSRERLKQRASSMSSDLLSGVDVREQLERLQQLGKRTLVFDKLEPQGRFLNSSLDSTGRQELSRALAKSPLGPCMEPCSEEEETDDVTGTDSAAESSDVAQELSNTVQIMRPLEKESLPSLASPESPTPPPPPEVGQEQEKDCESANSSVALSKSIATTPRLLSPLRSPPHSPGWSPTPTSVATTTTVNPPAASYTSGTKSCEPFKHLDTIIEGRGLLLGAEQQADPNYTNLLRRLSGNHSRRSSISSTRGEPNDDSVSSNAGNNVGSSGGGNWCRCDQGPWQRKSSTLSSTPTRAAQAGSLKLSRLEIKTGSSGDIHNKATIGEQSETHKGATKSSSVFDTMRSLARRTFKNLAPIVTTNKVTCDSETLIEPKQRQLRSTSMMPSTTTFASTLEQPTMPSQMLREQFEKRQLQAGSSCSSETGSPDKTLDSSTTTISTTTSASSSMNSLDDAENYHAKNKDNKVAPGRSLDSSSTSSGESVSSEGEDRAGKVDKVEDEEEEEEEEEVEEPKICYKCNKMIRMEEPPEEEVDYEDEEELEYEEDDEEEEEEEEEEDARVDHSATTASQEPSAQHQMRRRRARRSVSVNLEGKDQPRRHLLAHNPRRKNKWHIQRNLAPKLKRQRSFSANYAPEVPNPMMPPPRRFSAAPTLTCPHRNKSSSTHSSSSLHHTYSIDSSESMITVIPSNRSQEFLGASRAGGSRTGSLSATMGLDGSLFALPRSPLSPRSPSRSPHLLTPTNPSAEPPSLPVLTSHCPVIASQTNKDDHSSAMVSLNSIQRLELDSTVDGTINLDQKQQPGSLEVQVSSLDKDGQQQQWEEEDPNAPVMRETINDLCYRHTLQELEHLIGSLNHLRICDSYFSETSSTLCMVIEVNDSFYDNYNED